MNPKVIVIDGKTYKDVSEMPPDVRQNYEQAMRSLGDANNNQTPDASETMNIFGDKNQNGVPDVLDNIAAGQAAVNSMTLAPPTRAGEIVIDGKEFNGLEDLPPDVRARYEEAMGKLDANRNGIPDFVEGMIGMSNQSSTNSASVGVESTPAAAPLAGLRVGIPPSKPLPVSPTITPDTSNGWMLMLAGLFLFLLCVAGAAGFWYFFLR